jgi:hypothetical protein
MYCTGITLGEKQCTNLGYSDRSLNASQAARGAWYTINNNQAINRLQYLICVPRAPDEEDLNARELLRHADLAGPVSPSCFDV